MKTSTLLKPIIYFFFLATVFSACKKEPATTGMEGTWVGKYGAGNEAPSVNISFVITEGKKVELKFDGVSAGEGSYTLNGTEFTATINNDDKLIFTTTYDSETQSLELGTWGYSPSKNNGGTWYMDLQE